MTARVKETVPVIDCRSPNFGRELLAASHDPGMFYLLGHGVELSLLASVLSELAKFFALPASQKEAISIKNASNFRGYGVLKNYRDWREQIHLALEGELPVAQGKEDYWRLSGINQWPESAEFKQVMTTYLSCVDKLSRNLLTELACALGKDSRFFTARMGDCPYLLVKGMAYFPQEKRYGADGLEVVSEQSGVMAHCDWSWLTFLLQDDVGGLFGQDRSGHWHDVEPLPGSLIVNTGELLELESAGYLRACPHKVLNRRMDQPRFSLPVFVNPALHERLYPIDFACGPLPEEHVHKVIEPGAKLADFVFGESEWRRKGLGMWCYRPDCLD